MSDCVPDGWILWPHGGALIRRVEGLATIDAPAFIEAGAFVEDSRSVCIRENARVLSGARVTGGYVIGGTIHAGGEVRGGAVRGGDVYGMVLGGVILHGGVVHPGETIRGGVIRSHQHLIVGLTVFGEVITANRIGGEWMIDSDMPHGVDEWGSIDDAIEILSRDPTLQDRVIIATLRSLSDADQGE